MEKKTTSAVAVVFYILGVLFLAVSVFMLVLAVGYTKTYIQSYDATFADMWTNVVQYVIKEFVPYLGIGIICIGIGEAVRRTGSQKQMEQAKPENKPEEAVTRETPDYTEAFERLEARLEAKLRYLESNINTTRDIMSIKIEEKEKRDVYRLSELGNEFSEDLKKAITEDRDQRGVPVKINVPIAAEKNAKAATGKGIGIFRVAQSMAMPDIPRFQASAENPDKENAVPIFTTAGRMAMPEIDFGVQK